MKHPLRTIAFAFTSVFFVATLAGCPRQQIDLCADPGAHPECSITMADLGSPDVTTDDSFPDLGPVPDATPDAALPCDGACADPTPICDLANDACVECVETTDCASGVCSANSCVECVDTSDCTTGVCATDNTCVECVANTDCTSPAAALCDLTTNTCAPCAASTDCGHLADTVCDTGECVECTGTEFSTCTGVCDSRLRTCTDFPAADLGLCEACVSDAQCRPGMLCIPMTFEAADNSGPAEVGTFCLWQRDSAEANAPNGSCFAVRPYVNAAEFTSLDGTTTNVCALRTTTCPALVGFDSNCSAPGNDADCGATGFNDGLCIAADVVTNLCTVPCASDNDCKPGFTCNTTVTPNRCEL